MSHAARKGGNSRSVGEGSKGPRVYDWAAIRLPFDSPKGWAQGVLARRSVSDPDEIAYYRVFAPEGTAVEELARVAGTRWTIGSGFERAKGEMGLDEYEVRRLLLARWGPPTEWEERLRWSRWRRRHQERARRGHYARWLRHHPLA